MVDSNEIVIRKNSENETIEVLRREYIDGQKWDYWLIEKKFKSEDEADKVIDQITKYLFKKLK